MAEGRHLRVLGSGDPGTVVIPVEEGEDLLEALQRAGVPIRTSCGGVATCGLCRITVKSGGARLTGFKSNEKHHLGNVAPIVGMRLACQARFSCEGEVSIDVPPVDDVQDRRRKKIERMREESVAIRGGEPKAPKVTTRVEWRPRKLAQVPAPPGPSGGGENGPR